MAKKNDSRKFVKGGKAGRSPKGDRDSGSPGGKSGTGKSPGKGQGLGKKDPPGDPPSPRKGV